MTELIAKPVLKNKFWIVENSGNKVATIQAVSNGGFVYVSDDARERYPSINVLSKERNVLFVRKRNSSSTQQSKTQEIYGFPTTGKPHNVLWDIKHHFPIYTKTAKSKSYFCAGHYLVYLNNRWAEQFCPKFITLSRYPYHGPFATEQELKEITQHERKASESASQEV